MAKNEILWSSTEVPNKRVYHLPGALLLMAANDKEGGEAAKHDQPTPLGNEILKGLCLKLIMVPSFMVKKYCVEGVVMDSIEVELPPPLAWENSIIESELSPSLDWENGIHDTIINQLQCALTDDVTVREIASAQAVPAE